MPTPIITDLAQFDALDAAGAVKPPEAEPVSSADVPATSASQANSASAGATVSGDSTAVETLDGEIAEDSTEDDEDPNDSRIFIRRKDGKFAPHAKKKIVGELKGRVSKLTAKYRDAEAELTRLRSAAPPAPPASAVADVKSSPANNREPEFDQFKDEADPLRAYMKAVGRWEAREELREREQAEQTRQQASEAVKGQEALQARVAAFAQEHPEFDEIVVRNGHKIPANLAIRRVCETLDDGLNIALFLGTHKKDALELAAMTSHLPVNSENIDFIGQLIRERMDAGQAPGAASSVGRPSAPRPLTPVRTGGGAREDGPDADVPFEQFFERENAKERKRQRR